MISRREALLGVLLAPLVKPVAAMLPKQGPVVWTVHESAVSAFHYYDWHEKKRNIWWSQMMDAHNFYLGEHWDYTGDKAVYRA